MLFCSHLVQMPTMHRLACLRDDLVFVVYLYQRHIYGIDKKRPNEYGQVEQEADEISADAAASNGNAIAQVTQPPTKQD